MADEKKEQPKPLDKEDVVVSVTPKDPKDPKHQEAAKRVKKTVEREVKKALDDNKGGGAKKQLDAAEEKVDEAKKQVSPTQVEKIKVRVSGKDGEDDVSREKVVKPKG